MRWVHDSAMSYLSEARKPVSHDSICCSEYMTVPCPTWVKPESQSLMTVFVAASTWQCLLEWSQKASLSWQCLLQRVHDSAYLSEARKPVSHDSVCCGEYMTVPTWVKPKSQSLMTVFVAASTWQCHSLHEWRWGACLQFIIKPWQCLFQWVHDNAMSYLSEDG